MESEKAKIRESARKFAQRTIPFRDSVDAQLFLLAKQVFSKMDYEKFKQIAKDESNKNTQQKRSQVAERYVVEEMKKVEREQREREAVKKISMSLFRPLVDGVEHNWEVLTHPDYSEWSCNLTEFVPMSDWDPNPAIVKRNLLLKHSEDRWLISPDVPIPNKIPRRTVWKFWLTFKVVGI